MALDVDLSFLVSLLNLGEKEARVIKPTKSTLTNVTEDNSDELSRTARDEGPDQILEMIRGWISRVY